MPSLAALPALGRRVTSAAVHITIDGDPESVPPVVEVSVYRIVEHLLEIVDNSSGARIDVRIAIGEEDVVVALAGRLASGVDSAEAFTKVSARVALHEGRLATTNRAGSCWVTAQIPVAAGVV